MIFRFIKGLRQRFVQTGSVGDRARSGQPRVTTAREDRYMTLTHLRQRFKTATNTTLENGISRQTVLNRLRATRTPFVLCWADY
jgi:hypothetical protein